MQAVADSSAVATLAKPENPRSSPTRSVAIHAARVAIVAAEPVEATKPVRATKQGYTPPAAVNSAKVAELREQRLSEVAMLRQQRLADEAARVAKAAAEEAAAKAEAWEARAAAKAPAPSATQPAPLPAQPGQPSEAPSLLPVNAAQPESPVAELTATVKTGTLRLKLEGQLGKFSPQAEETVLARLAAHGGVHPSQLTRWEDGDHKPSLSAMPTSAVTPMCTGAPGAGGGAKESGALKPPASEP
jgi:hypothetical protein